MRSCLGIYTVVPWVIATSVIAQRPIPNGAVLRGAVSFDGRATLGDFVGRTDSVWGAFTGGPDLSAVRGWVEATTALLTNNGRRDNDLKKSMETAKYPTMRFDLMAIAPEGTGDSIPVKLHGTLTIHGVKRDVVLPATVVRSGAEYRLRSDFPLNLKDYAIGGLSKMLGILKMQEDIVVHVDILFGP